MSIYLISDCHGNIEGLMRALERKKIVDKHGNRQLARKHKIIQIGDLANCVGDSISGDISCLDTVGNIIDMILIGNHEIPYIDPANKFYGFVWDNVIHHKIQLLMSEGLIGAAYLIGNTLVSHAGISKDFLAFDNDAEYCFNKIQDEWENKNYGHSWFSSIGFARYGNSRAGGILWCDFDKEFVPTKFPQIVGHTPKYVRIKRNSLCIDVGSKETEPFILEVN